MKVVLVNKSDSTGGAAVVTFRLMCALRDAGVDARMLVAEKLSDSGFVQQAASATRLKYTFLKERLAIFLRNGLDRSSLFKIDTCSEGVAICRHPWVRTADIICLNWVNQGLLSLEGIREIARLGKPLVWTMHDMWNMTGICHHAAECEGYIAPGQCGFCPLLGSRASASDLSRSTLLRKKVLYADAGIRFVAVSSWLAEKARMSTLLSGQKIEVIPNAFPLDSSVAGRRTPDGRCELVFGAARLDDPIKGWPILARSLEALKNKHPEIAAVCRLTTFGNIRDESLFARIPIPHRHLGKVSPERIPEIYSHADIVLSSSLYETLPGTLVEGQAYGCVPVAFLRGGQADIIDHESTGFLVEWSDDESRRAKNFADGIAWAAGAIAADPDLRRRMQASVRDKFAAQSVARKYIGLFENILSEK